MPSASHWEARKALGRPFLNLRLDGQIRAAIALNQLQEVLLLPAERLSAMPNMHPSFLGLMERRGRIFWVADLARIVRLPSQAAGWRQYEIVIVRVNAGSGSTDSLLGLAVEHIEGVIRLQRPEALSSLKEAPASFEPYLSGFIEAGEGETWPILDAIAIANSLSSNNPQSFEGSWV